MLFIAIYSKQCCAKSSHDLHETSTGEVMNLITCSRSTGRTWKHATCTCNEIHNIDSHGPSVMNSHWWILFGYTYSNKQGRDGREGVGE